MPNCIFALGKIDNLLIIPLIYLLVYVGVNFYEYYYEPTIVSSYIDNFAMSISEIMACLIGIIVKYAFRTKLTKKNEKQKYIKDFGILFIITAFYRLNDILPYALEKAFKEDDEDGDNSKELLVNDAFELIIISLATFFVLKYKYYKHHILSIVIIISICIGLDFLLDNFTHTNKSTIISSVFLVIMDSIVYSYFKYLIEHKYYFFLDVLYIYGIFSFFWNSVSFGIVMLSHKMNGTSRLFVLFYEYYKTNGISIIILEFLFNFIVKGFIVDILEFIILDKLTPNYIIIGYEIGKIPSTLIEADTDKLWGAIILSILQVLILFFYLEIFEFNFCSLNENTKKNIELRLSMLDINGDEFEEDKDDNQSDVDIKGYIIKNGNRTSCEMSDKSDTDRKSDCS